MLLAIQKKNTIFLNNLIINTSNKQELKLILYLISNMINNHHRDQYFFTKIKRILISLKDENHLYILNQEIFNFFKKSKITLLFLIESNIITFDESIVSLILKSKCKSAKYPQYFFKEIKSFLPKELEEEISKEIPENYEDQRLIGENDSYLCQLIQNDSIEEFAIYVNKTNTSLFSEIKPSIFETNLIFLKEKPTLIEYATFYVSIQIIQFLYMNKVDLSSSLWIYAIHSLKA